jgi:hypothetical protein
MARGSWARCAARTDGGIWESVSGCGELYKVDSDDGLIGGGAFCSWYVLTSIHTVRKSANVRRY